MKSKVLKLARGGFVFEGGSYNIIALKRKKIMLSYPQGMQLSKVRGCVDGAFKDLERREP